MSNNNDEFDINDLFIQTAFGEDLRNFYQQWQDAETIDQCLNIISSPSLTSYARTSVTGLVELVETLIIQINEENNSMGKFNPHQCYTELKTCLESNLSWLYPELRSVKSKIPQIRKLIERWQEDESSEAFGAGALGGIIGASILGPVGAIVGGAIGGALSSSDLEGDVKADFQALLDEYSDILCRLATCIEENVNISERFLVAQIQSLPEAKQKSEKALQPS